MGGINIREQPLS